jgi:hypothetical protein
MAVFCIGMIVFSLLPENYNKQLTWRYKISVEVMTPEGLKKGESVREVHIHKKMIAWDETSKKPHYSFKYKSSGEAVIIDISESQKVFGVLSDNVYSDVIRAFNLRHYDDVETLKVGQRATLPKQHYPKFVRFKDMNDPLSVELVPSSLASVEKITIEVTEEPVRYKIKSTLPWLGSFGEGMLDGRRFHTIKTKHQLANSLGLGSFTSDR